MDNDNPHTNAAHTGILMTDLHTELSPENHTCSHATPTLYVE